MQPVLHVEGLAKTFHMHHLEQRLHAFSGIGFTSFRFVGFLSLSLVGTIIARFFRFVNSNNYHFYYYFVNKL